MSIGNSFRGIMRLSDSTIDNINIQSNMFTMMRSDLILNNVQVSNITRDSDSTARFFRIESTSDVTIENSTFEDINFSLITLTDSILKVHDSEMNNITASQYIIECYSSQGVVIRNLSIYDSQTDDRPSIINFRDCTIESISDSKFTESQLLVFVFRNSLVKEFDNNILDSMNRGIKIMNNSNATISNSVFKNMKQNIKENTLYYSDIKESGSAIGKVALLLHRNREF